MTEPRRHRKGIVLAGGSGARLHPMTQVVNKHLLPVYDKPMVYYPLSVLMLAEIRNVLIVSTPRDLPAFERLLGDGSRLGMSIHYARQSQPGGLAEALLMGREFIAGDHVALALGDNIFYGTALEEKLDRACRRPSGATCFAYHVNDPGRFGVVELDSSGRAVSLEEKPQRPKSDLAVTGLYFYDNRAVDVAANLKPSARGELEITDVNRDYLQRGQLHIERLGRGFAWLDAGTPESLLQAASLIATIESRQGLKIACLEEIAYNKGFIDAGQLAAIAEATPGVDREYLRRILS